MKTFTLTFSQCKAIINELGRDQLSDFLEAMNDQPEFLQECGPIDSVYELCSLDHSGCASNAHWSVFYANALECMAKYSDSVEETITYYDYLEDGISWDIQNDTFASFCSKCCVVAVESFVSRFGEEIEILAKLGY